MLDERDIAERTSCKNIGLYAAGDEVLRDIMAARPDGGHVLYGGRLVVDIASVDLGAMIE